MQFVANNNSTNTTTFTAKEDLVNQNYQTKQEIQALRERIKYPEEQVNHQQQREEEWSDTGVIDLQDKTIPIKVTVNNVKRKVVLMEIDIKYYKRKAREYYREQQQRQKQENKKMIFYLHSVNNQSRWKNVLWFYLCSHKLR